MTILHPAVLPFIGAAAAVRSERASTLLRPGTKLLWPVPSRMIRVLGGWLEPTTLRTDAIAPPFGVELLSALFGASEGPIFLMEVLELAGADMLSGVGVGLVWGVFGLNLC